MCLCVYCSSLCRCAGLVLCAAGVPEGGSGAGLILEADSTEGSALAGAFYRGQAAMCR